jgi:type I restriction enzyme S subunit
LSTVHCPSIPPGYKQTEVGVIPEEWEVVTLGHLIKLQAGYSFRSENFSDIGTPVIRISDIQDGIVSIDSAICHPPFKIDDDFVVKNGDFLVAMSGATTGKVGVFQSQKPAYQNQRVGRFVVRDENRTSHLFIGQLVRSSWFGARLSVLLEQGAQPNVSGRQIESLVFPVPSQLPEQRAIAEALSDVDGLLGGLDRLIAKKRDLKQAAMQQLLTGQTRLPGFHGEWVVKRLGSLGAFLKGSGVKKDEATSGNLPCVRYGEIYTHHQDVVREFNSFISASVAANATPLRKGDILFAGSGETKEEIGKAVAFVHDCEAYAGGDIVIFRPEEADPVFLGYYLNSRAIQKQKTSRGQGDAVVHISAASLAAIELALPPLPEQIAIAEVLTDMDAELAALELRREKTRALKQAMMQELLTGRTRLV